MKGSRKNRNIKIAVIAAVIVTLFAGMTAAAQHLYGSLLVNGKKMPDLEPLGIVEINDSVQVEEGIDRVFLSMDELEKYLGIQFLRSPDESAEEDCYIRYEKRGRGDNAIRISAYITGDATDIVYDTPAQPFLYSWKDGEQYKKPIDMKIRFRSDDSQKDIGKEYLGVYSFLESYTSAQGYTVDILKQDIEGIDAAYTPYIAVFSADNVQYELNGRTGLEEMKRIIDTLQYEAAAQK